MKKYFLSFFLIITFAFYVMLENQSSISVAGSAPKDAPLVHNVSNRTSASSPVASIPPPQIPAAPAAAPPKAIPPAPVATGLYRDGSYTGDSVDAYYGNVQVETIISGGKLADVKILDYPQDRGTSIHINGIALPQLIREAIQSQSAHVDIVSGATQTSEGFRQSLASTLAQAKG